jgi:hypothetical protein
MICSHCFQHIYFQQSYNNICSDEGFDYISEITRCPACKKVMLSIYKGTNIPPRISPSRGNSEGVTNVVEKININPRSGNRPPPPPQVQRNIRADYLEASLILYDSPKASAALSRRALQSILREVGGVKPDDLAKEIQKILDKGQLPTPISESIDHIRNVGNFAAHPIKSKNTGEIIEIEPGEAEYNLDVIDLLFDFYYIQPEIRRKKKESLDKKLADAGKPPMKIQGI